MTKPLKAGLMCVALVLSGLAGAETDAERQILQKPMPHQGLSGGKTVLVHWSQTRFSMYSKERNDATIREYQGYIRECLASSGDLQKLGFSIQPPKQWPDYLNAGREDRYVTSNYAIAYRYGWGYGFDGVHCGLIEVLHNTATLESNNGICHIDLDKKTAHGQCDIETHRRAAPTGRRDGPSPEAPPSLGAGPIATGVVSQSTGEKRSVAGLVCEVFKSQTTETCFVMGGSFLPIPVAPGRYASLVLEGVAPLVWRWAIEAQLDAKVDERVFTPHLTGGFKISRDGDN